MIEFPPDIIALDDEMRSFVRKQLRPRERIDRTVDRLLSALTERGYYDGSYEVNLTQTAEETFHSKRGNCLSYTNLFVALAREAGLDARYQQVFDSAVYDATNGVLQYQSHINVLVKDDVHFRSIGTDIVVDFNFVDPKSRRAKVISDEQARALFLSNKAVGKLLDDEPHKALIYVQEALRLDDKNPDIWVNLAVLNKRFGEQDHAVRIYEHVLSINPRHPVAIVSLQELYQKSKQPERALSLQKAAQRLRDRNPYYFLALAQKALNNGDTGLAIRHLDEAISLNRREAKFYALRGISYYALNDEARARENIEKAVHFAKHPWAKLQYERLLFNLNQMANQSVST